MIATAARRWSSSATCRSRSPTGDEVLVRVRAASVNRGDLDGIHPKPGFVRLFIGLRRPRNPRIGLDAAGVVEAIGPDVTRFRPGDAVFADLFSHGMGAFADYVCATERAFEPIPDGMSFEDAATLPHAAILALQSLRTRGGRTPAPGERVLIGGASGNVGPFAVQIAKAYGAEVTGVCSTAKMDFVRSVGADHVIDYTAVDYTRTGERYDWIVDVDLHHSVLHVRPALRAGGVYVTLGGGGLAIGDALIVGSLVTRRDEPADGPDARLEAVRARRRREAQGADRGGSGAPDHRPAVPAGRGSSRRCGTWTRAARPARS